MVIVIETTNWTIPFSCFLIFIIMMVDAVNETCCFICSWFSWSMIRMSLFERTANRWGALMVAPSVSGFCGVRNGRRGVRFAILPIGNLV